MSGVGELLSKASEREERLRKTEEFLAKHLHDRLFVDYFNVFLNLPVFGQRMLLKLHDGHFIFDPPVFTEVNHDRIVAWIAARRFHLFTKTHLFLEYQLCHKLQNLDFELRFYDSARSRRTHHVLQVFANNLLGSVAGMYLFREHLRNSSGSKVFGCWLHVQRFRQTRNLTKRREIFHEIQQCYLHATAFHKLSNRLCKVVAVELLPFPVVPHSETELSARLTTDHYVPSCEVDLSSPKALGLVHRVLLEALRAYWAPCYVMHVLSTQPFTILKELFRVPGGDIILSSSELKILIGRCALFSIQDGQDLIPKHGGAQFESDEWIFSLISSSSSTLSSASSSLTRGKTGGSSFDSVHCVESSDQKLLSRLCSSFLSSERQTTLTPVEECGQPKSADLLNLPSDKGETSSAVSLLRDDKVQVEVSRHHDDTSDEELAEVCAIGELLDTGDDSNQPVYDDEDDDKSKDSKPVPLPSAARRLEPASSSLPRESLEGTTATREDTRGTSGKSKVSDELEDDDRRLRLNLTILALKEMSFKPEPMLYLNQLLRHYLFGYRHLDQEKPVTDRRTLCLLACDDLAGSPFRSYLRGQDPRLHLSYFDFWSAMRRYQQLHDLYRMGNTMNTKYGPPIASLRTQHILYMVNRFFMGSGLDAKILQYRIRINILEDMKAARWSPLINSTLDVVSNVLGIPMMQFILNDRQDFRKHAIDSGTFEVKPKQGPKDKVVIESGLPKVFNSLLKRGTEAASQGAFANRRCLSDPWREDPKHDPDGDMECLRPTDSRGTKYNGVVGVLGEQHRLLAFQFLIVLREDLPDAQVCDVASLARIVRSDYGSLHIHCPSPVKTNYLTILRPERRTFSTTWLKQSSLPQNVPLRTTFSRLSTTVNVRQLLQIRQNRESSSFVLPPKPRTFSDILADETQFQAFKKYLRGKDQAQILSFCEDVQDARRVENSSDRDMIVQKIVEYHFKAGGEVANLIKQMGLSVSGIKKGDLPALIKAQLALEKQIQDKWFQTYIHEMYTKKVQFSIQSDDKKEDWLRKYLEESLGEAKEKDKLIVKARCKRIVGQSLKNKMRMDSLKDGEEIIESQTDEQEKSEEQSEEDRAESKEEDEYKSKGEYEKRKEKSRSISQRQKKGGKSRIPSSFNENEMLRKCFEQLLRVKTKEEKLKAQEKFKQAINEWLQMQQTQGSNEAKDDSKERSKEKSEECEEEESEDEKIEYESEQENEERQEKYQSISQRQKQRGKSRTRSKDNKVLFRKYIKKLILTVTYTKEKLKVKEKFKKEVNKCLKIKQTKDSDEAKEDSKEGSIEESDEESEADSEEESDTESEDESDTESEDESDTEREDESDTESEEESEAESEHEEGKEKSKMLLQRQKKRKTSRIQSDDKKDIFGKYLRKRLSETNEKNRLKLKKMFQQMIIRSPKKKRIKAYYEDEEESEDESKPENEERKEKPPKRLQQGKKMGKLPTEKKDKTYLLKNENEELEGEHSEYKEKRSFPRAIKGKERGSINLRKENRELEGSPKEEELGSDDEFAEYILGDRGQLSQERNRGTKYKSLVPTTLSNIPQVRKKELVRAIPKKPIVKTRAVPQDKPAPIVEKCTEVEEKLEDSNFSLASLKVEASDEEEDGSEDQDTEGQMEEMEEMEEMEKPVSSATTIPLKRTSITKTVKESPTRILWRKVTHCLLKFTRSLRIPDERQLFEIYLKQELQKSKMRKDKSFKVLDVEGFERTVYTRQALRNLLIEVNNLPTDLRFWVEANRYKEQINSHVNYYLSVEKDEEIEDSNQFEKMDIADQLTPAAGDRPIQNSRRDILAKIENDNPILGMRARAIVECFFKSVCDPVIQVNCCTDKNASQIISNLASNGVTPDLFHDICIRLLPLLYNMWKDFSEEWLSHTDASERQEKVAQLLKVYKNPIIGDFPHPEEPSADYLHIRLSDFSLCPVNKKDVKDFVGCLLTFDIRNGTRVVYPETFKDHEEKTKHPTNQKDKGAKNCNQNLHVAKTMKNNNMKSSSKLSIVSEAASTRSSRCRNPLTCGERKQGTKNTCNSFSAERELELPITKEREQNLEKKLKGRKESDNKQTKICYGREDCQDDTESLLQKQKYSQATEGGKNGLAKRRASRDHEGTRTCLTHKLQKGKQQQAMQQYCSMKHSRFGVGQREVSRLLSPTLLSPSRPRPDGCLRVKGSQSLWGPGSRSFNDYFVEQVSRLIILLFESRKGILVHEEEQAVSGSLSTRCARTPRVELFVEGGSASSFTWGLTVRDSSSCQGDAV